MIRKSKKEIRKITRQGKRSFGITLPIELVRSLGWRERQRVSVTKKNGALVVRDAPTSPRLRRTRKTKKKSR